MQRGKIVAIISGAISILLAVAYLILVQLLDFRGEMVPAPINLIPFSAIAILRSIQFELMQTIFNV